jgi:hypothetical protein
MLYMLILHILAITLDTPHSNSVYALNTVARPGRLRMVAEIHRCVFVIQNWCN